MCESVHCFSPFFPLLCLYYNLYLATCQHLFKKFFTRFLLPSTEGLRTYSMARSASVAILEEVRVDCPIHWVVTLARSEVSIMLCLPCIALVFDCSLFLFESLNGFFGEVAHTPANGVFSKHSIVSFPLLYLYYSTVLVFCQYLFSNLLKKFFRTYVRLRPVRSNMTAREYTSIRRYFAL